MDALERVADKVELISTFRSYDADGEPERQEALRRQGEALAKRIAAQWRAAPAQERPDLWFTYHLYYKAPDWLGPAVSETLGIPYVEFAVRPGAAPGIGRFYERVFAVKTRVAADGSAVAVPVGRNQEIVFRECASETPYDGHHIAVYVADFSGPHRFLNECGLVTEESDAHQYRFRTIVDPENRAPLFEIEHEVRSLKHPMWGRTFVNRNPAQTQRNYRRGRDAFYG